MSAFHEAVAAMNERVGVNAAALIETRGQTHGSFADNARNGQFLRDYYRQQPSWASMPAVHREALDMIACKLSRILSGQSMHEDHWRDVQGYAALALKACDQPPT